MKLGKARSTPPIRRADRGVELRIGISGSDILSLVYYASRRSIHLWQRGHANPRGGWRPPVRHPVIPDAVWNPVSQLTTHHKDICVVLHDIHVAACDARNGFGATQSI